MNQVVCRYMTGTTASPAYPIWCLLQDGEQQCGDLEARTSTVAKEVLGISRSGLIALGRFVAMPN